MELTDVLPDPPVGPIGTRVSPGGAIGVGCCSEGVDEVGDDGI